MSAEEGQSVDDCNVCSRLKPSPTEILSPNVRKIENFVKNKRKKNIKKPPCTYLTRGTALHERFSASTPLLPAPVSGLFYTRNCTYCSREYYYYYHFPTVDIFLSRSPADLIYTKASSGVYRLFARRFAVRKIIIIGSEFLLAPKIFFATSSAQFSLFPPVSAAAHAETNIDLAIYTLAVNNNRPRILCSENTETCIDYVKICIKD